MKSVDELVEFSDACESGVNIVNICTYTKNELRSMANFLVTLPVDSKIVEIGTLGGRSASLYLQLQRDLNLDICLIDNYMWHGEVALAVFNRMILHHFPTTPYGLIHVDSKEVGAKWHRSINFLHIDGDHDRCSEDCELFLPHVVSKGLVAFHDSTGDTPGVTAAVDKYVKETWELVDICDRLTIWRKP